MMGERSEDLDEVRENAIRNLRGTERWPGDPLPAAKVEEAVARAALANAWGEVANLATTTAGGVRIRSIRTPRTPGADLRRLIKAAEALEPAAHAAAQDRVVVSAHRPPR